MNIRPVGFLDLSVMTSTFVRTYRERLKDDANYAGAQTLLLRGAREDAVILKDWKSARAVLTRLKNEASVFLGGKVAQLGKAMVVSLKPSSWVDWKFSDDEYSLAHMRLVITMIPSPCGFLYAAGEGLNPPVGQVVFWNQQVLHSQINVGVCSWVTLVVDVKRPEDD